MSLLTRPTIDPFAFAHGEIVDRRIIERLVVTEHADILRFLQSAEIGKRFLFHRAVVDHEKIS